MQKKTIVVPYLIHDDSVFTLNSENNRKVFINLGVPDLHEDIQKGMIEWKI